MTDGNVSILGRFARHRVAAHVIMLLMIVSGLFAISRMNVQFFPNFALDVVNVSVVWSGASAEDVERGITDPLEQRLRSIENIKEITSTSAQGSSTITIEFQEGTDPVLALDDVRNEVDTFRNFPADAEKPQVNRVPRFDPIARVVLYGDVHRDDLREWVDRFERDLLSYGVDRVNVNGLPEQQIGIHVSTDALYGNRLSLDQIADVVNSHSRDLPAGQFGDLDGGRELRAVEQARDPQAFADLPLIQDEQTRIALGEIADIQREDRRHQTTLTYEGLPAVELELQRSEQGDSLDSARALEQWLEDMRPTLPDSLSVAVYDQSWQLIRDRINLLVYNGAGGLLLVLVLLYLFLPARVAFWVAVGIPSAFLAALAVLWLIGGSINMISLFALIMALGVIVDDAIVVGEDADAHFRHGEKPLLASEGAAHRMFWPVVASSATTIAAFMPLLAVGGTIGKILYDIPVVMICVIAASLIESFLVLPGHLRRAFVQGGQSRWERLLWRIGAFKRRFDGAFEAFRQGPFRNVVRFAITYRGVTLGSAVATILLAVGLIAGGRIGFTFFPTPEPTILYANANFVAGTDRGQVDAFLDDMVEGLERAESELGGELIAHAVRRTGATAGAQSAASGDQLGSMIIELVDPDDRDVRNEDFIARWKENTPQPPGLESFSVTAREGGPPGSDLTVRLTGGSAENLKRAAMDLSNTLQGVTGVVDVSDDLPYGREQVTYSLNSRGEALGLTTADIGFQLRAAFDGDLAQIFQSGRDEVEVRVLLPEDERDRLSVLGEIQLRTPDGAFVPLDQVVDIDARRGFEAIRHAATQRAVEVMVDIDSRLTSADNLVESLERDALPELMRDYQISYTFEGKQADQRETMADMKFGLYLGLVLMYIVLVWVFAAWTTPFIVMTIIPFGLVGAIFGHWVMDIDLTILSMFGLFGLAGIVVNNAIILVAFYNEQRRDGLSVTDALEEAATRRLRAVLLTSLTTIGGLTPLLFETSLQAQFLIPMATSIAFGLGYSTLLVLLVIPALLSLRESLREQVAPGSTRQDQPA